MLKKTQRHWYSNRTFTLFILLPSVEGRDEKGGLEDLAGSNGMCGRGLREVGTGWRGCEVMVGENAS